MTPRLPEPPGPRSGVRGEGTAIRLIIVGDSAAAGVGAASQDEALSGRLVEDLSATFRVSWLVVARTGATTSGTARHLARRAADACGVFDVAVLSLGGNDAMGTQPVDRWLDDMTEVAFLLRERFSVRRILISGLPPVHAFPAFPQPLRGHLGARARRFDQALAAWAVSQPDCEHLPLELPDGAGLLATDGLHPGPQLYQRWATEISRRIRACWEPGQP